MKRLLERLSEPLERRRKEGLVRGLRVGSAEVDFCSNDYLGLARDEGLAAAVEREAQKARQSDGPTLLGSTGSRLLTGNNKYYEEVEASLAAFYGGESALLFNSGYDLNLGLFASLPQPGDVVVFDELMHNSVREGLKLSRGSSRPFKHNDPNDLRQVLDGLRNDTSFSGNVIISVESVYSMDGHCAPLNEICEIAREFDATVVVDEAHGVGVFGKGGRGFVSHLSLESEVLCRVCTFGKAVGAHGAVLIGPSVLREYMLNYCRPLIYSTSLPLHSLAAIQACHNFLSQHAEERQAKLFRLVKEFTDGLNSNPLLSSRALVSPSAIQGLIVPGNDNVVRLCSQLQMHGWDIMPIRSPTVPKGTERLRIILHWHNTHEQVQALLKDLASLSSDY